MISTGCVCRTQDQNHYGPNMWVHIYSVQLRWVCDSLGGTVVGHCRSVDSVLEARIPEGRWEGCCHLHSQISQPS